jgi:hypothetical protein
LRLTCSSPFVSVYTYNIALDVLVVKKKRTKRIVRFQ